MTGLVGGARRLWVAGRARLARRDEAGSVAPFVVIVSVGLLLLAGLVIDGGRQLNAKGIAIAYAQEAARAGAQAVNIADPSLGLLDSDALSAANNYCAQARAGDATLVRCHAEIRDVTVNGTRTRAVEVETEVARTAIIIGMIGRETLTASGIAQARPISGIDAPDDAKLSTLDPPSVVPPGGGDDDEGGGGSEGGGGGLPISTWTPPSPSPIAPCLTPTPEESPETEKTPGSPGTDPTPEDPTTTPTETTPTESTSTCIPPEGDR